MCARDGDDMNTLPSLPERRQWVRVALRTWARQSRRYACEFAAGSREQQALDDMAQDFDEAPPC